MKHVAFALAMTITLLAIGCQDNNITAPSASPNITSTHQLNKPTPQTGVILLKGGVLASNETPWAGMIFQVTGEISYDYRYTGEDNNQAIEFSINTHANLVPSRPILPSGAGNDQSVYSILVASKAGVIYLQRDCYIPELDTKLHILLSIAEDNTVAVESMWIGDTSTIDTRAYTN